tara:strand:- start:288 stop:590 length:303 start_codon:yes stop_codon:yes gene_type:complete
MSDKNKKDFVKLNTDQKKKKMMNEFELAVAKSMTKTDLDPLGSAAVLLKLALTVYHEHLKDKYAVEEVIFHALKTIDGDWFDDQVDDILNDLYIGDKTIH